MLNLKMKTDHYTKYVMINISDDVAQLVDHFPLSERDIVRQVEVAMAEHSGISELLCDPERLVDARAYLEQLADNSSERQRFYLACVCLHGGIGAKLKLHGLSMVTDDFGGCNYAFHRLRHGNKLLLYYTE